MKKFFIGLFITVLLLSVAMFVSCAVSETKPSEGQTEESDGLDNEKNNDEHVHSWGQWETVFFPDCVTNGLKICHCTKCGVSNLGKIPALGHTSEVQKYNQSVHFCICTRCGVEYDIEEHSFDTDKSCKKCGYECDYTLGLEYEKIEGKEEFYVKGAGDFEGDVLIVPATYKGLPVTKIGDYALKNIQTKKIVLPDTVRNIGCQAFRDTTAEEIVLPQYAETLGNAAFYGCNSLKKITLPEGLKRIENNTFYACLSLREIVIPDSVVEIGYQAFDHCYTLTKITLGKNLESIEYAFLQCNRLLEVYNRSVLPVTADGTSKFGGVARNAKNVYSIGVGHTNLTATEDGIWFYEDENAVILLDYFGEKPDVFLPATINGKPCQLIGNAFFKADQIESLTVPGGIKEIPSSCFTAMKGLTELKLEEGIESVGGDSFTGNSLTVLRLPSSLVSVEGGSFGSNIQRIEIAENNPVFMSAGNCLINKQSKTLVRGFVSSVIPTDGCVETIGENAFAGLEELKTISIPSAIRKIETRAFFNTGLNDVTFSNGLESIGMEAFAYCKNLTEVSLPDTLKEIYVSAFIDSPIEKMTFLDPNGWTIKRHPSYEGDWADAHKLADPLQAAVYFNEVAEYYANISAVALWVKAD